MGEKRQSSKYLKWCIEDRLYLLMTEMPYSDIDVKMLCDSAYVGRTSFYRYFKSLDDVILYSFKRMWEEWCETHKVQIRDKFALENAVTFFEYNLSISDRLTLVYKNDLEHILLRSFEEIMNTEQAVNYENRFYAYGLFALLKEWYLRGFKETPEEVAAITTNIIKKTKAGGE